MTHRVRPCSEGLERSSDRNETRTEAGRRNHIDQCRYGLRNNDGDRSKDEQSSHLEHAPNQEKRPPMRRASFMRQILADEAAMLCPFLPASGTTYGTGSQRNPGQYQPKLLLPPPRRL